MERILPQEKIDFYREHGFVQIENALPLDEVDELDACMQEVMEAESQRTLDNSQDKSGYYKVLNQKVNTWRDHGGMAKFSFHPRLAQMAMELSGASGVRLFHDHALWKMPGDSKRTPWHQDLVYWPMNEPGALSIWLPTHDVDEHNGCMMFVPGSHKAGKLNPIDLVNPQDIFEFVKDTDLASRRPVMVPLKKGGCTFHNGLTFHYAHPNMSDTPRRVLATIYMPANTTYNGKPHVVTDGQNLTVGEKFRGGLFPVIVKA